MHAPLRVLERLHLGGGGRRGVGNVAGPRGHTAAAYRPWAATAARAALRGAAMGPARPPERERPGAGRRGTCRAGTSSTLLHARPSPEQVEHLPAVDLEERHVHARAARGGGGHQLPRG